jgi:hypothetical protein
VLWPPLSARRVFIGHLVFAKAAKAGGNQTAISRQSATPNRNIHDPVTRRPHRQHLVHPQLVFVRAWMWSTEQSRLRVLGLGSWSWTLEPGTGTYLFRKWQMGPPGWAGPGGEPRVPQPTPWPTAAPGGAGREGGGSAPPLHLPLPKGLSAVGRFGAHPIYICTYYLTAAPAPSRLCTPRSTHLESASMTICMVCCIHIVA